MKGPCTPLQCDRCNCQIWHGQHQLLDCNSTNPNAIIAVKQLVPPMPKSGTGSCKSLSAVMDVTSTRCMLGLQLTCEASEACSLILVVLLALALH